MVALSFGKLRGSALGVCVALLVLVVFVIGFVSAFMFAGLDTKNAAGLSDALQNSDATKRQLFVNKKKLETVVRRPVTGTLTLARKQLERKYRYDPTVLTVRDPITSLDRALTAHVIEASSAGIDATAQGAQAGSQQFNAAAFKTPDEAAAAIAAGAKPGGDDAKADPAKDGTKPEGAKDAAAPPKPPEPPVIQKRTATAGGTFYTVQLGVFRSSDAATVFAAEQLRMGRPVAIVEEMDQAGRTWDYVRLGRFSDRALAGAQLADLERQQVTGLIVAVTDEAQEKK